MNAWLKSAGVLVVLSQPVWAQSLRRPSPVYPFVAPSSAEIKDRTVRFTEEEQPILNVYEIERNNLEKARSAVQPWSGSFWPLIQGQIANNYQEKSIFDPMRFISWRKNVGMFKANREARLGNILGLSEERLALLAPSEKYDVIMGDASFDLTNRIWKYAEMWGSQKKWGFLSSIELPEGFRIPKSNDRMAFWEGICHGWALAAGGYPRPERTVYVTLSNGKRMAVYPDDIKALVSLAFAHSIVQERVISEGLRCNEKSPPRDELGRYIDKYPKNGEELLPRCADVHPAVWHLALVNNVGKQGRSMVVEIDANAKVNNHPLLGYRFEYFNPKTGRNRSLEGSIQPLNEFRDDPYKAARNPEAKSVVGIEMTYEYIGWTMPKAVNSDGPGNDEIKKQNLYYDLELDANGNIVGGQWRTGLTLTSKKGETKQPDFIWTLPKNYMTLFQPAPLEPWDGVGVAPESWRPTALSGHAFMYRMTHEFGFREKCPVIGNGRVLNVDCEFTYPRPQPLTNVIQRLVELSAKGE